METNKVVYYSGGSGLLFLVLFLIFLGCGFWFFWIFAILIPLSLSPMIYYRYYRVYVPPDVEEKQGLVKRKSELEAFYEHQLKL
jgi:hypothetical protein